MKIDKRPLNVSGTFTDGQVMLESTVIADFFTSGRANIRSIVLLDKDAQSQPIDIVFSRQEITIGTEGSPVSINDVNANRIYGIVQITSYIDLVNSSIAQIDNLLIPLEALNQSNDLWISLICRGSGIYSAGLTIKIGLEEN